MNEKLTPDNFLEGETVTMNFPKTVKMQLDDGAGQVTFFPGVQEVPAQLANHWWLKHNGVTPYSGSKVPKGTIGDPAKENELPKMTERELLFLQSRGYTMTGVQEAQMFYDKMDPAARPGFSKSVDMWFNEKQQIAANSPGGFAGTEVMEKERADRELEHNREMQRADEDIRRGRQKQDEAVDIERNKAAQKAELDEPAKQNPSAPVKAPAPVAPVVQPAPAKAKVDNK